MSDFSVKRTIIGKLAPGTDLYEGITQIASDNRIMMGRVTGLGAVQTVLLGQFKNTIADHLQMSFGSSNNTTSNLLRHQLNKRKNASLMYSERLSARAEWK